MVCPDFLGTEMSCLHMDSLSKHLSSPLQDIIPLQAAGGGSGRPILEQAGGLHNKQKRSPVILSFSLLPQKTEDKHQQLGPE